MSRFLTNIDLQKNQITNVAIHNIANASVTAPVVGQLIYDADGKMKYWNGTAWLSTGINGITITPTDGTLTIANGTTFTSNNTITLNATNGAVVYLANGGNVAYREDKLSVFASTNSAEFAGVISDETGTDFLVFSNAPTLTNPIIDNIAASAAGVNADLWSEITTGSIVIGAGLTSGAVNVATAGAGATSINIGHDASTVTFLGNVSLPATTTTVGQTILNQGTAAATITFPSATGTLALIGNIADAELTLVVGPAAASGTAISIGNGSGFTANETVATQYDIGVGPSISALATAMANGSTGFIKKTSADTYAFDSNTYLTAESDTLETVTGRGNSSSQIISITNATANILGNEGTGALIVAGGVGIGGNVSIGGNLNVDGSITYINSTEVDIGDSTILLNALITNSAGNSNGGVAIKRFDSSDNRKDVEVVYNDVTNRWQTTFGDAETTLVTANLANKGIAYLGDGTNTAYSITHNFNTQDLVTSIRENASPYALVYADVEFTSVSTLTVKFAQAPTTSQYKLTIIG